MNEELEKARTKIIEEKLEALQAYKLRTPFGSVVLMPSILKDGSVRWDSKTFFKGVSGHTPVSAASIKRIDGEPDWLEKVELVKKQLEAYLPDSFTQLEMLLKSLPEQLKKDTILIE